MWIAMTILIAAICLGAAGQVCLKAGVTTLGANPPVVTVLASIINNRLVLGGFACYGISSLLYIVALSRLDLSYAYPMIALSYVIVAILAWRLLGEIIPAGRVVGLAIICIGVVVLALSYVSGRPTPTGPEESTITQALPDQN